MAKEKYRDTDDRWKLLFFVPAAAHLVFWFLSAPDLRFAGAAFWILGAGSVALFLHTLWKHHQALILATVFAGCGLISVVSHLGYKHWIVPPGRDFGLHPAPGVPLTAAKTRAGLTVFMPLRGDQCWDAPLPCTPYLNPHLGLIEHGDLKSGFWVQPKKDK